MAKITETTSGREGTTIGDGSTLSDWGIPGTYVFDASRSRAGYMAKYDLTGAQRHAIRDRDWLRLMKECGGNIYYVYKIGAAVGDGLYNMGAQMRGQSFEEFLQTRSAKDAR
jgi:protocatechuate 4,5-dioxygenase alpha chain